MTFQNEYFASFTREASDPLGRLSDAQPAFATPCGAINPMNAGDVTNADGFVALGWFIAAVLMTALTLMAIAALKADGIRGADVNDSRLPAQANLRGA